jgi:tyrosyl-tRNA synthetase
MLAAEVTALVHGTPAMEAVIAASEALFGQGDLAALDAATLRSAIDELPRATGTAASPISQLLVEAGLTASLGESRRAIEQGGVYLNNTRVDDVGAVLGGELLAGGIAVLRRGKRTLAGVLTI